MKPSERAEQKAIYKVSEAIIGRFEINCERYKCGNRATIESFDCDGAASAFYEGGWRIKRGKVVCPKH